MQVDMTNRQLDALASSSPADQILPQKQSGVKSIAKARPVFYVGCPAVVLAKKAILTVLYVGFK